MTIALIDGDVLAYMACGRRDPPRAMQDAQVHIVTLNEDGDRLPMEYSKEEDTQYLMECWDSFQKKLTELCDRVWATDFVMAVKGPGNYRDLIYSEYKANRRKAPQLANNFVPSLRKLAVMNDLAIESNGREADDMLRIWANQAMAHDNEYVICSMDKDLKCIPGRHYLMHKDEFVTVTEEEAMRHYFEQLLKGDPVDNIPGIPKVGPVKAAAMLKDCQTLEQFQAAIVDRYFDHYGEAWYDMLLSNAKMIHLQRHLDDFFDFSDWPLVLEMTWDKR